MRHRGESRFPKRVPSRRRKWQHVLDKVMVNGRQTVNNQLLYALSKVLLVLMVGVTGVPLY